MAVKGFHIGTSGWSYKGWIGDFYPENLSTTKMLSQYAKCFGSVEVNTSFYGTTQRKNHYNLVRRYASRILFFPVKLAAI